MRCLFAVAAVGAAAAVGALLGWAIGSAARDYDPGDGPVNRYHDASRNLP